MLSTKFDRNKHKYGITCQVCKTKYACGKLKRIDGNNHTCLNRNVCFLSKAQIYMGKKVLCAGDKTYRIVEIEFYEYSDGHPDIFTHCHPQQLTHDEWYFHRGSKKPDSKYRGGTFKGVDITFGNKNTNKFGGMIIRSIHNIETGETIEGPCRCVNQILSDCKVDNINDLVSSIDLNVEKQDLLYVKKVPKMLGEILCGPRIGLKKGKSEEHDKYVDKHYRFVVKDMNVKKQKKSLVPAS